MITAIIGGSGFCGLPGMQIARRETMETPFGAPSAPLVFGKLEKCECVFINRHGDHGLAPHRVNYRANLWALQKSGAARVVAFNAVGGIGKSFAPGALALPDQIIDYTYGRAHTFHDGDEVHHIDFAEPYDAKLRAEIMSAAQEAGVALAAHATHAVTQGPRLESAAEIDRLERDGAGIVGMTGMPEAALARELNLPYAAVAIVINPAAGRAPGLDRAAMARHLQDGVARAVQIVARMLQRGS